ncbi:MAG: hypothetical protein LBL21_00005, partial [Rickettsiales bacterium]|nr:hypothetical protein [Rickettsiales bacterium]
MKKNDFRMVKLANGEVNVYDFGRTRLHAYRADNPIGQVVFVLEKAYKGVVIEAPCFHDNRIELERYISSLGVTVEGILSSYHVAGGDFLKGVKRYGTLNAEEYRNGSALGTARGLAKVFGPGKFDASVIRITDYIARDLVFIAGIRFDIDRTDEAFDIEIPELNAKYVRRLGNGEHSFAPSIRDVEKEEKKLLGILRDGYDLILSSHHMPEDSEDLKDKIMYLRHLRQSARDCMSAREFKSAVRAEYPDYGSGNFLDMTAEALYGDRPARYRRAAHSRRG